LAPKQSRTHAADSGLLRGAKSAARGVPRVACVTARRCPYRQKIALYCGRCDPDGGPLAKIINIGQQEEIMRKALVAVMLAALAAGGALMTSLSGRDANAQSSGLYVNAVDLDIAPGEMAKYIEAVKENGAASVKEPGCREFNITVSADNPNHVFLYEVYDNEEALNAHRNTEHFKKYQATTANMVVGRNARAMSAIALNAKGH
jgi:(4S)-4-hydroxy-5-phosphonooxypentane-2,3-dione isomerase